MINETQKYFESGYLPKAFFGCFNAVERVAGAYCP